MFKEERGSEGNTNAQEHGTRKGNEEYPNAVEQRRDGDLVTAELRESSAI